MITALTYHPHQEVTSDVGLLIAAIYSTGLAEKDSHGKRDNQAISKTALFNSALATVKLLTAETGWSFPNVVGQRLRVVTIGVTRREDETLKCHLSADPSH